MKIRYDRFPICKHLTAVSDVLPETVAIIDAWSNVGTAIEIRPMFDPSISLFQRLVRHPSAVAPVTRLEAISFTWNRDCISSAGWMLLAIHPVVWYSSPAMKDYLTMLRWVHKRKYPQAQQLQLFPEHSDGVDPNEWL